MTPPFESGFLSRGTIGIWGQIIHCCRGCPVHCRMLGRILGLCPLRANVISSFPGMINKNVPRCPLSAENHCFWLTS